MTPINADSTDFVFCGLRHFWLLDLKLKTNMLLNWRLCVQTVSLFWYEYKEAADSRSNWKPLKNKSSSYSERAEQFLTFNLS